MRILVTGAAGFIGSHLCDWLQQKHEVYAIDNLSSGQTRYISPGCLFSKMDCRDLVKDPLGNDPLTRSCQFIFHLASTVGVRRILEDPKECIENIIESTRAVLGLGIPGIYFSTSEVYGKSMETLSEDSKLILGSKMRWTYAGAKLIGEFLARQAGWKIVRLFNVVGSRQSSAYGAVLPRFVEQALNGEPITVYGDGSQVRTFLDVHDCVEILDRLREAPNFGVVNVGGKAAFTILELANVVKTTLKSDSPIVRVDYEDAYGPEFEECPCRIPNLSKLHTLVGFPNCRCLQNTIFEIAQENQRLEFARCDKDVRTGRKAMLMAERVGSETQLSYRKMHKLRLQATQQAAP